MDDRPFNKIIGGFHLILKGVKFFVILQVIIVELKGFLDRV